MTGIFVRKKKLLPFASAVLTLINFTLQDGTDREIFRLEMRFIPSTSVIVVSTVARPPIDAVEALGLIILSLLSML